MLKCKFLSNKGSPEIIVLLDRDGYLNMMSSVVCGCNQFFRLFFVAYDFLIGIGLLSFVLLI